MLINENDDLVIGAITKQSEEQLWGPASELLYPATKHMGRQMTMEQLHDMCLVDEKAIAFVLINKNNGNMESAALVTIVPYHGHRMCNIELCGGDSNFQFGYEWGLDSINRYMAKEHDCINSRVVGREGWKRHLKKLGYQPTHFFAELDIRSYNENC